MFGASAQISEPTMKVAMPKSIVTRRPCMSLNLP